VADSCKHGNEDLVSVVGKEFLVLLNKSPAPWNYTELLQKNASSVNNKNSELNGKGTVSYMVYGQKVSEILWGCIKGKGKVKVSL
jgi:hypothetical protein